MYKLPLEYYRINCKMFNLDEQADLFFMICDGNGMTNAGIQDKDLLLFKTTNKPVDGSIVAVEVDGKVLCRRYIHHGPDIILRRDDGKTPDIIRKRCKFKGELVSWVRNFS